MVEVCHVQLTTKARPQRDEGVQQRYGVWPTGHRDENAIAAPNHAIPTDRSEDVTDQIFDSPSHNTYNSTTVFADRHAIEAVAPR